MVRVDAMGGYAPLALELGIPAVTARAKTAGIAALQVSNSHHFAALWPEVEALASNGLVVMAMVNSMSFVHHHGGKDKVYGTNPMAFGWPRVMPHPTSGLPDMSRPLVWDQASSGMSRGDMSIAARDGKTVPPGLGVDLYGEPSTDPDAILEGAQSAFGGHKGCNLALMIELLASGLGGGQFAFAAREADNGDGGPTRHGQLVICMDPSVSAPGGATALWQRGETLFEQIVPKGSEGRLPADRRYETRQESVELGSAEVNEQVLEECLWLTENAAPLPS